MNNLLSDVIISDMKCVSSIRCEIIRQIADKISCSPCTAVVGFGGMGKSWIAEVLNQRLTSEGATVIRITCRESWNFSDFTAELSRLFSCMAENIIEILENREITLILDNYQFIENHETNSLLYASLNMNRGKILLFSRKIPDFDPVSSSGICTITLNGLTEQETIQMTEDIFRFHNIAVSDSNTGKIIHRITRGHPFSVKIICGLLLSRKITLNNLSNETSIIPHLDFYLEQLIMQSDSVETSYLLKLLCFFRMPVEKEMILESDRTRFPDFLEKLHALCLIETGLSGKISVQELIKEFILRRIQDSDKIIFHRKCGECYSSYAHDPQEMLEAYHHFSQAGDHSRATEIILNLCHQNLYFQEASENICNIIRSELCMEKPSDCQHDLQTALAYQYILLDRADEAKKIISSLNDFYSYYFEACLEFKKGNSQAAFLLFKKCTSFSCDPEIKLLLAGRTATCLAYQGQYSAAADSYESAMINLEKIRYPAVKAWFYKIYGNFCYMNCQTEKAIRLTVMSITALRDLNCKSQLISALCNYGYCLCSSDQFEEAETAAKEALNLSVILNDSMQQGHCCSLLAEISLSRGKHSESVEYRRMAIDKFRISEKHSLLANNYCMCGFSFMQQNDLQNAEIFFKKGLSASEKCDNIITRVTASCFFAEFLLLTEKPGEAEKILLLNSSCLDNKLYYVSAYLNFLLYITYETLKNRKKSAMFLEAYNNDLENLSDSSRKTVEQNNKNLIRRLKKAKEKLYVLRSGNKPETIEESYLNELLEKNGKQDILLDFVNQCFFVDGQKVNLNRSRTLVRLLFEFASHPGENIEASKIYPGIWNRSFETEKDAGTFRSSISRLRKLLDPADNDRFIKISDGQNSYHFSTEVDFFVIFSCSMTL